MRSRSLLPLTFAIITAACQRPTTEDHIRAFSTEFVHDSLALTPSYATSQGYHEHNRILLDELLDDYSPSALSRARDFYDRSLKRANALAGHQLTPELRTDIEVAQMQCQAQLLDLNQIQLYRHNPTIYVESIGDAIYSPFILDYAPESKRLTQITARIEKIGEFLATAKQNLTDSPQIWADVAREENQGNIELIDHTVRAKIPPSLKARYDRAAESALNALHSFDAFLRNSRHTADWRLGPQLYAEKFRLTLATGDTPQQALSDAEAKLQSIRNDMYKQALVIYPKFFPGKRSSPDVNVAVAQVLDKIAQQHATPATYFEDAKRYLSEATQFIHDHHLLALPKGTNLQVIPTPEFMRGGFSVGGFSSAPALQPQLGAYYWITPFTPDMTSERIESKLREYNTWGLKILTIHEAMPGHYVQSEYANQLKPAWRRDLRAVFSNGPYAEGWAVYATEFMIDNGYDKTPEMQLTFGKQMLRVVSNTILDIKLHTMQMTDQHALDLMINQTFQEKEEAIEKLQRAKLSSCQLPTYFVGWRGWDRLRDAYRAKHTSEFRLSEFNERALNEGSIPMPALSRIVLQ